ncbi:MAG: hypothetical protein OHK0013_38580 [Sandaracinaceae bacterium]
MPIAGVADGAGTAADAGAAGRGASGADAGADGEGAGAPAEVGGALAKGRPQDEQNAAFGGIWARQRGHGIIARRIRKRGAGWKRGLRLSS